MHSNLENYETFALIQMEDDAKQASFPETFQYANRCSPLGRESQCKVYIRMNP
jgi:hypothetical protein